ncbi:MAG TPA: sigma 54-interacting transcriptional regulator, partial [Soehngenia sp.]|nr:sigma 54-interacting transcriptional regulator [Soehngenia sp.]
SKNISLVNNNVNTLNTYLNNIVDSLVNGILVIDENGYIKYANEQMTKLLSPDKRNIENRNVKNLVDKEALKYFMSADFYENKEIEIFGSMIKTSKFKIPNSDNVVITTSKEKKANIKSKFTQDLLLKGHFAKYDFEDIIGKSSQINEVKLTALKLSKSELTVLIEGESGTGKELFASAIHNTSNRKDGPFLAVNFSALPDELIESELFGYEEGAFTGAKKGGKIGLFELADGGTIFLDEIGDISLKVQTKLLRVLQEKEIMPVGGTTIKSVDVRVIGATNKDLRKMVKEKQFRSDLYYRLKIGYINLPPLRERVEDISELVEYFIAKETSKKVKIAKEVIDEFENYKWLGNVRELESTIKYMLAVRTTETLTLDDLPDKKFFEEELEEAHYDSDYEFKILNGDLLSILNVIKKLEDNNLNASRTKIVQALNDIGIDATENKIRTKLNYLEEYGYITKNRGKKGTALTRKGLGYLNSMIIEGE